MADTNDSCHLADAGDPDVAGLGVTIAFLISVCLTGMVILVLYVRRGLSPDLYNNIDDAIIARLRKKQDQLLNPPFDPFNKALRNFLFTLSDQQLAQGLSLAVVVYIRFAQADAFSTYSFQMATTTVFMSCLTHMSTLAAVPDLFPRDGGHFPRLVAMMGLAILMFPLLIISNFPSFAQDPKLSCKCAFNEISSFKGLANAYAIVASASITLMVIIGYVSRIKVILKGPPFGGLMWIIWKLKEKEDGSRIKRSLQKLKSSFLWELISLTLYYTFGIPNFILTWKTIPPLQQWSLSFGQLLPAALLLFSVMIVYADYGKEAADKGNRSHDSNQSYNNTRNDSKRVEDINIEENRAQNINNQKINMQVDDILSSPSPLFLGHNKPIEGGSPASAQMTFLAEQYTIPSSHVPILTSVAVLAFVMEEFVALLLGGALDALGVPFLFYGLLTVAFLRVFALLVIGVVFK